MIIHIAIDAQEGVDLLDVVDAVVCSSELGSAAGAFAVSKIISRTLSGKDVDDSPFAPYSESYGKRGPVNLVRTGEMLASLEFTEGSNNTKISCDSSTAKYHEEGTDTMPQRRFMGLSTANIEEMITQLINDPISQLAG